MKARTAIAFALLLLVAPSHWARAAQNQFHLADQYDWTSKRGFYLDLENDSTGGTSCKLDTLKLVLSVGDGTDFHPVTVTPAWAYGHDYQITANISPDKAELLVDGVSVGTIQNAFRSDTGPMVGGEVANWASGPTEYQAELNSLAVQDAGGQHLASTQTFPLGLQIFDNEYSTRSLDWTYSGKPFTVTATFRLTPATQADTANTIDRYGQTVAGDWRGKVRSDSDLKRAIDNERKHTRGWAAAYSFDQYGGLLTPPWRDTVTGYYHTVKHSGIWWLIDPLGAPCYYVSVCTVQVPSTGGTPVTGREHMFSWLPSSDPSFAEAASMNAWAGETNTAYASFPNANLIRKFGSDWKKAATAEAMERLHAWGFCGVGKWSTMTDGIPSDPVLYPTKVPWLAGHVDFFDPAIAAQVRTTLQSQIEPHLTDPFIVGWSFGNEDDQLIRSDEIKRILAKPAETPSRKALMDHALSSIYGGDKDKLATAWGTTAAGLDSGPLTPPDSDIEQLRQFYADAYYSFVHDTIKSIDSNHLFLGWWLISDAGVNLADWNCQVANVDVMGIDVYTRHFADAKLDTLLRSADKPAMIGEYSFPPNYRGARGFGDYYTSVGTDKEAAQHYRDWMQDTATNPWIVGVSWFEWCDEPITGRGPGQGPGVVYDENYAFGLLDDTDNPKWGLVDSVHNANLMADTWRLQAASPALK